MGGELGTRGAAHSILQMEEPSSSKRRLGSLEGKEIPMKALAVLTGLGLAIVPISIWSFLDFFWFFR